MGCSSQALAEALKINCSVRDIKLGYNRILDEGAKAWYMHRVSFAAMPQTHFVTRFVLDLGWSWCVHVNCLVRSVLCVFESVIEYD